MKFKSLRIDEDVVVVVFLVLLITMLGVAFALAGAVKKEGHDLYWKNKLALAPKGTTVIDSLVPEFLLAPESFQTDGNTGELVTGSQRRAYSNDHLTGWVLIVKKSAEVKSEGGQVQKLYDIETQLVFDLREGEKQ